MAYFDTLQYVDAGGSTQEVALSLANVAGVPADNQLKFTPRSHAASELVISWSQAPETAINIPFKSRCKVYIGRSSSDGSANSFTGGTILFQGRRWDNEGNASATRVRSSITLCDAWKDLEKITYAIPWKYQSGGTGGSPTYSTYNFQDVVLFQANTAGMLQADGTYAAYSPSPHYGSTSGGYITTWQQITAIINYALCYATGSDAVQVQIGSTAEFTPTYCNWYPVRSAKLAECLLLCLRPHPGVFTEMDYSTSPPTLHFRNRANLTGVTLPYKSTDSNGILHVASDIQSLDELVPDAVRLWYKINSTVDGKPALSFSSDIYPGGASNSLLCQDFSIDVTGPDTSRTEINFVSTAFDPTSLNLWRTKLPGLKQISQGGQIPNDGSTGALTLVSSAAYNSSSNPKGIQVIDESGNPIDYTGTYIYYTDQPVYGWFNLGSGAAASVVKATVKAFFTYQKKTANLTDAVTEHEHHFRVILTNAPSNVYTLTQTLNAGESIPPSLAQNIYTELSTLQWKLSHQTFQIAADATSLPTVIKPGKHKINLSGGASAWSSMNAVPENVSVSLMRVRVNKNDGSGPEWRLAAQQTIRCGPVNHLEPGYLVQLQNLFWNRNRSGINAMQPLNGTPGSSTVDLSATEARENSTTAPPVFATQNLFGVDAVDSTRSNVLRLDSTGGQIKLVQQKTSDNSVLNTGVMGPYYQGTGAPSSSTLPASTYYRVFDFYVDVTNISATPTPSIELWICIGAGTNSTSVWYQLTCGS